MIRPTRTSPALLGAGLATIYVVWGTTYLGIRVGVETIPPFFLSGTRYVLAGLLLFGWVALRGGLSDGWPNRRQWLSAIITGTGLVAFGNGLISWGEQYLPSGPAALFIATVPLWMTVMGRVFQKEAIRPAAALVSLVAAGVFAWRARCYLRQRDYEAAREDVERALELAQSLDDHRTMANVYFQASLVSERMGHWVLARSYAERAKAYYEQLNDERNVGRLLNNLGGLNFQLGKPERAVEDLKSAYTVLLDKGSDAEAANVVSSLAHVHLMTGQVESAEKEARHALELLEGREDFLLDIAPTQLVLGRSLMEQGRLDEAHDMLRTAEASAEQLESISHRAAAWMAQGDLAARQGEDATAARLYRKAAEALQDVRF